MSKLSLAMILSLLGVPDELIIKDYLSSLKNLQPIQSEIIKDMRRMGLPEEFSLVNYEVSIYLFIYFNIYFINNTIISSLLLLPFRQ